MAPFVFIACEKSNEQLGLNQVIDESLDLADTTLDVISYTQKVDSILVALEYDDQLSLGGYSGNRLVGSHISPYFGLAQAGLVSEMVLNTVNLNFGTNPVVDSVKLYLRYSGSYGDTSKPMSFDVFQLQEALSHDSLYFSDFVPRIGQQINLPNNILPKPNTPSKIGAIPTLPTLEIPLDPSFFQQNFADRGNGSFEAFSSNDQFIDYFKGIHVKTSTSDGSILYFNLNHANSAIRIYYHNVEEDSLEVSLNFSQGGNAVPIHFSIFDQDYASYPTGFDFSDIDSLNGEDMSYVQAMGGVATVLEIPGLDDLVDGDLLINQAVLEIEKASGTGSALAPPARLELREFTGKAPGSAIVDFRIANAADGNGVFRSEELHQGYYRFNLTRYLFDVANTDQKIKLVVVPVVKSTAANQVILQGGTLAGNKLKLKLYYTKL